MLTDPTTFYLASATLLLYAVVAIYLAHGLRKIKHLSDFPTAEPTAWPRVSVLVAARDEEGNLEEALLSVLGQDYENMEVIVVDDRSTDRTGAILDRVARDAPRLTAIHLTELPAGWIGKNHALYRASREATGELLLFTDADVVMQPSVVRRGVAYMMGRGVDHLTLATDIVMPDPLLDMFVGTLIIFFLLYTRPWKVADPRSNCHIGIGAFNLVRKEVYEAVGTHEAIAMRPDDDLKLGKLIKINGYRQEFLFGTGLLSVEWYASLRDMIDGLMKNAFAAVDYRVSLVVGTTIVQLAVNVWPFAAVLLTGGTTRWLNLAIVLVILLQWGNAVRTSTISKWWAFGFPIATLLLIYIQWKAMLTTLFRKGIDWRGTHYRLDELKANKV